MPRGKRTRRSVGSGPVSAGAPIQHYFKVRRRASYVSGVTQRKGAKAVAVSCCSSDSDESKEAAAPCFMCEEGAGRLVVCTTPGCDRRAHPACVGLDERLRPISEADPGAGSDAGTGSDEARFQPASDNDGAFLCDKCTPETEDGRKYSTLACNKCGSGADDAHMLVCDGCDRGFHMYCVVPLLVAVPLGKWFCSGCRPKTSDECTRKFVRIKKRAMADQTSILEFFNVTHGARVRTFDDFGAKKRKRRRSGVVYNSKAQRQVFRLPVPTPDVARRVEQLAAVAAAMQAKGIEYTDELRYSDAAPRSMNVAANELGGLQPMTKTNLELFRKFKTMTAQGLFAPMMVTNDPVQGFVVRADARIPDRTLLCEYVGRVHRLSDKLHAECDSLMELVRSGAPTTSLVISPKRVANIARFLSGINNHTAKGRRSQNVRSARFEVDGESRVLLYAARDISKGEMLSYDYNAAMSRYPTQHFV